MALDRDLVVQRALEELDESGLESLTLRRIAAQLDVQAPALYWHFKNKQELLDSMAQAILLQEFAALEPPSAGQPWWDWLMDVAMALRRALLRHRDGARVVAGASFGRAITMGVLLDLVTRVLHDAGLSLPDALRGAATVVHFTIGFTIEEQSVPDADAVAVADLSERLPVLAEAMHQTALLGAGSAGGFRHGLRLIVLGMKADAQGR